MKHAKRMILVPEDVYNKYEQKQKFEVSPITMNMMQKDTQLSHILHQDGLSDDQRQKLFNANFEQFLNLKKQKDIQIPTVRVMDTTDGEERNTVINNEVRTLADSVIVQSVPKTMRERATAILQRLKTKPDIITWDDSGQVKLDGVIIPQSNISDLISDAVRGRKNFNPTGSREFFRVLSKINIPRDLVRNDVRWEEAQMETSPDEEDGIAYHRGSRTKMTTPKPSPTLKKTRLRWIDY